MVSKDGKMDWQIATNIAGCLLHDVIRTSIIDVRQRAVEKKDVEVAPKVLP